MESKTTSVKFKFVLKTDTKNSISSIVKLEYIGPLGPKVAVVGRWSLFRVYLCNTSSKWDFKIVAVIGSWSLFGGSC